MDKIQKADSNRPHPQALTNAEIPEFINAIKTLLRRELQVDTTQRPLRVVPELETPVWLQQFVQKRAAAFLYFFETSGKILCSPHITIENAKAILDFQSRLFTYDTIRLRSEDIWNEGY